MALVFLAAVVTSSSAAAATKAAANLTVPAAQPPPQHYGHHAEDGGHLLDPAALFSDADTDKNGYLDGAEIRLHRGLIEGHGGKLQNAMKDMDQDNNGKVEAEEFLTHYMPRYARQVAQDEFRNADDDKDDHLSFHEWYQDVASDGNQMMHNTAVNSPEGQSKDFMRYFDKVDTNHDEKLSLAEYMADAPGYHDHFSLMDKDHNGQVNLKEYAAYQHDVLHVTDTKSMPPESDFKDMDKIQMGPSTVWKRGCHIHKT